MGPNFNRRSFLAATGAALSLGPTAPHAAPQNQERRLSNGLAAVSLNINGATKRLLLIRGRRFSTLCVTILD
jgi:hypothetical protein